MRRHNAKRMRRELEAADCSDSVEESEKPAEDELSKPSHDVMISRVRGEVLSHDEGRSLRNRLIPSYQYTKLITIFTWPASRRPCAVFSPGEYKSYLLYCLRNTVSLEKMYLYNRHFMGKLVQLNSLR